MIYGVNKATIIQIAYFVCSYASCTLTELCTLCKANTGIVSWW